MANVTVEGASASFPTLSKGDRFTSEDAYEAHEEGEPIAVSLQCPCPSCAVDESRPVRRQVREVLMTPALVARFYSSMAFYLFGPAAGRKDLPLVLKGARVVMKGGFR